VKIPLIKGQNKLVFTSPDASRGFTIKDFTLIPDKVAVCEHVGAVAPGRMPELTFHQGFLSYSLPSAGHVMIKVFSTSGKQLAVVASGFREAGRHVLDLPETLQQRSMYIVLLRAGNKKVVRKVLWLRK
jgi:hypothetical protein